VGLHISDDLLRELGLDERGALIEFACRMFQSKRAGLWQAAKIAGLSRVEMEEELRKRGIPAYAPTVADLHEDLETLKRLGA
jgi:predicted HTH domain antitoxin